MKSPGAQTREKEHFDKLVESGEEIWWGSTTPAGLLRLKRRAQLTARCLRLFSDPWVLELGCGTGAFTKVVLEEMPLLRLTGCDISPKAVGVATRRYAGYQNARFEVADVTSLQYAANSLDAVIGNSVLHHLPVEASLRECLRTLKPGGMIWFSEPNMMNPEIAIEKNVHFIGKLLQNSEDETAFLRWSLAKMLRQIGYERVAVEPYDFLHPIVPKPFIGFVDTLGQWIEKIPLAREISGSLMISAFKPAV